ncbi:helix-turn-helix domain-containing protein [Chryseolinea soli]|uniref:AraC family transcriptional regulator n=1 Tax=Chryseolinea soli TaxID=2321403 RepID=A0A385SV75_9BACT|nr:helix-turn-helix domain-containing protein [Chryseolinea soli]AYB34834.1 AraC family transcriptional regulator [Chryseolinea soli]
MASKNKVSSQAHIPLLENLVDFYKFVGAAPPLSKDFDLREVDTQLMNLFDSVVEPFRHRFYCVSLYLEGGGIMNTGFWKTTLSKPALYFKTPNTILSWVIPEGTRKEYYILFTEAFLIKHKALAELVFDLPFFQLEKAIPFEIEPEDAEFLAGIYKTIQKEYHSDNIDKFEFISGYTYLLLLNVRRLYFKFAEREQELVLELKSGDDALVNKFQSFIKQYLPDPAVNEQARTVNFYASLLNVHPYHLNAVVKRVTKETAISFIHRHIINEAKSLLIQTNLSIKEITFKLGFNEPAHFNNFFKKQLQVTPAIYRTQGGI